MENFRFNNLSLCDLNEFELNTINGGLGCGEEWNVPGAREGGVDVLCFIAGFLVGFFD